jgi:nucleoside-diphosphate-sugar epimerase
MVRNILFLGYGNFVDLIIESCEEIIQSNFYIYSDYINLENRILHKIQILNIKDIKFDFVIISWKIYDQIKMSNVLSEIRLRDNESRVIFLSSVAVYGNSQTKSSEISPTETINEYGRNKLLIESLIEKHFLNRCIILRIANVFGAKGLSHILDSFKSLNRNGVTEITFPLRIYRDFIHYKDIILILDAIISRRLTTQGLCIVNIASGRFYRIDKLLRKSRIGIGGVYKLRKEPINNQTIFKSKVSVSKMLNMFGPLHFSDKRAIVDYIHGR